MLIESKLVFETAAVCCKRSGIGNGGRFESDTINEQELAYDQGGLDAEETGVAPKRIGELGWESGTTVPVLAQEVGT